MGFSHDEATRALAAKSGNVEAALDMLLTGGLPAPGSERSSAPPPAPASAPPPASTTSSPEEAGLVSGDAGDASATEDGLTDFSAQKKKGCCTVQ